MGTSRRTAGLAQPAASNVQASRKEAKPLLPVKTLDHHLPAPRWTGPGTVKNRTI
ncbi:MAG: hypothetical protein HXY51_11280 [Nitrospirae bacterium]|nr:hypothetical protein [Nitrospirota bacterium]